MLAQLLSLLPLTTILTYLADVSEKLYLSSDAVVPLLLPL
jgi:hypothetical protein